VPSSNPWLGRGPLNFAHQGGAKEAPSNTLYAFKTAISSGAEALEMDVHATVDRHLVVIHDATVDRTTNGNGRIDQMSLDQLKQLDAAFWWQPGFVTVRDRPDNEYMFRGVVIRTRPPPQEFSANDFTIPTLREVLELFHGTYINLEIKETDPETRGYEKELAHLLREFGRESNTIVASFNDKAIGRFRDIAPEFDTSAATLEAMEFRRLMEASGEKGGHPYVALQIPVEFGGQRVLDRKLVEAAHLAGIAVHAWTIDDEDQMRELLALGVEGLITDRPALLRSVIESQLGSI
jgi:glycerophosphoryl diester phosphodiesterase